jgi:hypothetical protein
VGVTSLRRPAGPATGPTASHIPTVHARPLGHFIDKETICLGFFRRRPFRDPGPKRLRYLSHRGTLACKANTDLKDALGTPNLRPTPAK